MKVSNYNFFFANEYEDDKYIAYNSLSNSLALIDSEKYKQYLDFEKNGVQINDKKLVEDLKKGSFILNDGVDELLIIRHNMYAAKFDKSSFGLTIAPTSDCNFRCTYCYERDAINNCYMNEETENNIVKMLKNRAAYISNFNVMWYGGEPLLAVNILKRLSEKFIKICNDNNIAYNAGIITNGYNLTKKNWEILKECKVDFIQITIDGDEKTHNERRIYKNGKATFNKIISNLINLKDEIIPVSLRINVDKTNFSKTEEVLKIISYNGLTDVVRPYLAKVENYNNCCDESNCLSVNEFESLNMAFMELMEVNGYKVEGTKKYRYPTRKNVICTCDKFESYTINADGEVYKCWNDIGKGKYSINNINDSDNVKFNQIYLDYIMFDPTVNEKCSKCKYIAICMGGCPNKRINSPEQVCEEIMYKFEDRLKSLTYKLMMEKNISKESIAFK